MPLPGDPGDAAVRRLELNPPAPETPESEICFERAMALTVSFLDSCREYCLLVPHISIKAWKMENTAIVDKDGTSLIQTPLEQKVS